MTNFDKICNDAGFGDVKVRSRRGDIPLKRQAVWCKMYMTFGNYRQIGIQSGHSHATVMYGVRRFTDLFNTGDIKAIEAWEKIEKV